MRLLLALAVAGLSACTDPPKGLVVTVDAAPTVHGAHTLHVALSNGGGTITQDFDLGSHAFPVTFGIDAPGRTGGLDIAVSALDENSLVVGTGISTTAITVEDATVQLEGADFVVNTDFAGDQLTSTDFEAIGYQVTAAPDGTWLAGFTGACGTPCNMFGRRFDATGAPLVTAAAAGTNAFPLTTTLTGSGTFPAVAANSNTMMAFWDFHDTVGGTVGVGCRAFDATGNATPTQQQLATDSSTDVVSATVLSNQNFAVVWNAFVTTGVIRAMIVRPDCGTNVTPIPVTVNTTTTGSPHRGTVASSDTAVMFAWIDGGDVRFRIANNAGALMGNDAILIPKKATEDVRHVRLAATPAGFSVFVRWGPTTGAGQQRIDMFAADRTGRITSGPFMVDTSAVAAGDQIQSFGVAARSDGSTMVVWDQCSDGGDGNGCGVFGRLVGPTGTLAGEKTVLATTTLGDQTAPSVATLPQGFVAVWTDKSGAEPDHAGLAVRARILSP